jgi:hypothetical protein
MRRDLRLTLAILLAAALLNPGSAKTSRKKSDKKSDKKEETRVEVQSQIPASARKLKPSGALAAYMVTRVEAGGAPSIGNRPNLDLTSDPERFEKLFGNAVIFDRDSGARIVFMKKAYGLDYAEVRGSGSGFGVNVTDGEKTDLLINNYKFPHGKSRPTSGTVEFDLEAEMKEPGAEKEYGAKLHLTVAYIEDLKNRRVFNVPDSELEKEKSSRNSDSDSDSDDDSERSSSSKKKSSD